MSKPQIIIGMATCGLAAGGKAVYDKAIQEAGRLGIDVEVRKTGCVGMCHREPLMDIIIPGRTRVSYSDLKAEHVPAILESHLKNGEVYKDRLLGQFKPTSPDIQPYPDTQYYDELDYNKKQYKIVLKNCGFIDPTKIEEFIARGGYEGAKKAITAMTSEQIIDEVKKSGLRGRGGAGFPTGMKWQFCKNSPGNEKYIICNADEGDPGAFMDRSVLEGDPHSVIEGMLIGAFAIGATHGYIYCRAEYPLAVEHLNIAIEQATERGFLGKNIFGSGFDLEIIVKEGAGAFVCGEETALMNSIEGKRGMPNPRPPFPAQKGVWGKPSNINNVETWANVPQIITNGGAWYASFGTEKSKGTKVFALTGKINRTGLVEVPNGIPLKEIIYDIGGGIIGGKKLKAVQTGGPSGGCIPSSFMDTMVDYESLAALGSIVGSGGMVVMDEDTCMVDMARYFQAFCQDESCGKCTPCRVGTKRLLEILERIVAGNGREGDIELLLDLGSQVKITSLCGLGQTAPNPVITTIKYFRDEYEAHIKDKSCPACSCSALIHFEVTPDLCTKCGICVKNCPVNCISGGTGGKKGEKVAFIGDEACIRCGVCFEKCPFDAIFKYSGGVKKTS